MTSASGSTSSVPPVEVDRGRRDLKARSGEDERRAGGDRERAGALEEALQLAREDVHRGTLDQHVDAEIAVAASCLVSVDPPSSWITPLSLAPAA